MLRLVDGFAGDRGEERPWEPMNMTTSDWLKIKPTRMLIGVLVPTHEVRHPLHGPDTSHCGDEIPHVVYWRGKFRIADGHHRIARKRALGMHTVLVRVAVPTVHFWR